MLHMSFGINGNLAWLVTAWNFGEDKFHCLFHGKAHDNFLRNFPMFFNSDNHGFKWLTWLYLARKIVRDSLSIPANTRWAVFGGSVFQRSCLVPGTFSSGRIKRFSAEIIWESGLVWSVGTHLACTATTSEPQMTLFRTRKTVVCLPSLDSLRLVGHTGTSGGSGDRELVLLELLSSPGILWPERKSYSCARIDHLRYADISQELGWTLNYLI